VFAHKRLKPQRLLIMFQAQRTNKEGKKIKEKKRKKQQREQLTRRR